MYVLCYLDQQDHLFLVASIIGSVIGLAWGISVWLDFSFNKQLADDGVPATHFCIWWYHHALWGGYFVLDFSLRLLTIGFFLSLHDLWPWNLIAIVLILLVYLVVIVICTEVHNTEPVQETWEILPGYRVQVRRAAIAQRFIDGLILTFFVHILPADIRPAPKHHEESRLLFTLHPELRTKLMKIIIPLRALEYLGLGIASMWFSWDGWQCTALISLYITMHILLVLVMFIQRPSGLERQATAPSLDELSPEVRRSLSRLESQPNL